MGRLKTFDKRCASCTSKRRVEIDRRLASGESARSVSRWLASQGEKISHNGIASHSRKHLAVMQAVRERVAQAEEAVEAEVDKVVDGVARLERMAELAAEVVESLHGLAVYDPSEPKKRIGMTDAALYQGCIREVRELVKTRHEILHGKKVDVDGLDGLAGLLGAALEEEAAAEDGGDSTPPPAALAK